MKSSEKQGTRVPSGFSPPGKSSFDWAVLFAALALVIPLCGVIAVGFSDQSRRRGYFRWRSALAISLWCALLGVILRGFLKMPVVP